MTSTCRICEGTALNTILERARAPVFQHVIYRNENESKTAKTGSIRLVCCADCGFVFNADFDPSLVNYGPNYENDQSHSQFFLQHMELMADRVLATLPAEGGGVVEVGCGQGGFLVRLHRRIKTDKISLWGFDPSYRGGELPEGVKIWRSLLSEKIMKGSNLNCDAVVTRHVIEHVADPLGFLATIRKSVSNGVRLLVETPSFDWISANRVLQDVFYEHVNYFAADTLSLALARAGFGRCQVTPVFGGQYLWADASPGIGNADLPTSSRCALAAAREYGADVANQIAKWRLVLDGTSKTAVWGAGAKGITFVDLVDPDHTRIEMLVDINPNKQGAFAPSGHPIVSPVRAIERQAKRIVVMNPNYEPEVRAVLDAQHWHATLIGGALL
jgi:hypothetical protein